MFLLSHTAEIKDLSTQMTYNQADLTKNSNYSVLNNILDEDIVHDKQRFKTIGMFRFVELLNPKLFAAYKENFPMEAFSTFWCI